MIMHCPKNSDWVYKPNPALIKSMETRDNTKVEEKSRQK